MQEVITLYHLDMVWQQKQREEQVCVVVCFGSACFGCFCLFASLFVFSVGIMTANGLCTGPSSVQLLPYHREDGRCFCI